MKRVTWPAVAGALVTAAAFAYLYLTLNEGHIGPWSETLGNGGYTYSSAPSIRGTLVIAAIFGLIAATITALIPTRQHQLLISSLVAVTIFAAFALLVVPILQGPRI